jgi:hypothetical protein
MDILDNQNEEKHIESIPFNVFDELAISDDSFFEEGGVDEIHIS